MKEVKTKVADWCCLAMRGRAMMMTTTTTAVHSADALLMAA